MRLQRSLFLTSFLLGALLTTSVVVAQGKGGGKGGGGEDPPPSYNFPPFQYEVKLVDVPGMGMCYQTNDLGVTGVSMRPDWDPFAPIDDPHTPAFEGLRSGHRDSAAALVYQTENADGSLSGSVLYLDNAIDPALPYDFAAARHVSNSGFVVAVGWLSESAEWSDRTEFLLSPNPDAAVDGYAFEVRELPIPEWATKIEVGGGWRLNENGDVLYLASNGADFSDLLYHHDENLTVDLSAIYSNVDFWAVNSSRTLIVDQWNGNMDAFLLKDDGSEIYPELTSNTDYYSIQSIADNGFSSGIQRRVVGSRKVRGVVYPVYELLPVFHDPQGSTFAAQMRPEWTDISSGQRFGRVFTNEQIVANANRNGQLEPVMTTEDHILMIPGYDAATIRELMDATEQANYDALNFGNIHDSPGISERSVTYPTTPRHADGTVDHDGAPSFFEGAFSVDYPDGTTGFEGIYVVRPITP